MKKSIKNLDLKNKTVIIRVDYNVPIKNGIIEDDTRIIESLETIKYVLEQNSKIILMSHLGRIKSEEDKLKNSLKPVAFKLAELLKIDVTFISATRGHELEDAIKNMNNKEIILMENTRFEDYPIELESKNADELSKYWASLGDVFINDAFGLVHRAHASNNGIAKYLPSGVGFLIEKELTIIGGAIENPERPFTVILGGAKVSDKIEVIENLGELADYILIGGGMAFTFLKAAGINIGSSLVDNENIDFCTKMLDKYEQKIILPVDCITSIDAKSKNKECFINEIKDEEKGLDIGYQTIKLFKQYLEKSKTIIWNGPVGMFELEDFANGTKKVCEILEKTDALKIAGGGDTASAIINFGYKSAFTHISTGGGATLEMLSLKELEGLTSIENS